MRSTLNPEGLTLEEWVCAAGYALFDRVTGEVRPYTESSSTYVSADPASGVSKERIDQLRTSACRRFWHRGYRVYVVRNSRTNYSKKIRDAWKAGEDPTDHRAVLENKHAGRSRRKDSLGATEAPTG